MRSTFVNVLIEQAELDDKIFLLTPDMGFSVFEPFIEKYPGRFLNTGIAEQNAIGVAAGLSLSGFKPYVYSIAPFVLMRCYEQVRLDAAYMQTNIKIIGVGGGFAYGPLGTTHHAIEDLAITRALPGMIVCAPADPIEARQIFEQSISVDSPMYIRLAKSNDSLIHDSADKLIIGKAFALTEGTDIEILVTGTITHRVMEWLPELKKQGVSAGVTVFHTIKPLDTNYLDVLIDSGKKILIVEEHNTVGGFGEGVCSYLAKQNAVNKIRHLAIPDIYNHYVGSQTFILNKFGLNTAPNIEEIFECLRQKNMTK
jgi:transketolase